MIKFSTYTPKILTLIYFIPTFYWRYTYLIPLRNKTSMKQNIFLINQNNCINNTNHSYLANLRALERKQLQPILRY